MIYHASFLSFIAYFILVLQPVVPMELIPVEAGVEDRGVLSESLRLLPLDMRQDQSFEQLYKIAGSDGVYVRKSGGLYAIFKNSAYKDTRQGELPIVPPGTVYSIGQVHIALMQQLEMLAAPTIPENMVQPEDMLYAPNSISQRLRGITIAPSQNHGPVRFMSDEGYRRKRLAMMVLEIVLGKAN